jgi:hypothetical protein
MVVALGADSGSFRERVEVAGFAHADHAMVAGGGAPVAIEAGQGGVDCGQGRVAAGAMRPGFDQVQAMVLYDDPLGYHEFGSLTDVVINGFFSRC